MLNKKLQVAIARLLKVDEKVIETASDNEAGDDSIIRDFDSKNKAFSTEELGTLLKNSNEQFLEKADFEITKVPQNLYAKIAGAVLEKKEKTLAKDHGVSEYKDLNDLLTKIVESKAGKGLDEATKQQIETLKQSVATLEREKVEAVTQAEGKFNSQLSGIDFNTALKSLGMDYEESAKEKQEKLLASTFLQEHKLDRKNNKTIVLDKEGKPLLNKLGEPMSVSDVLKPFAQSYDFKIKEVDAGGRGTGNSQQSQTALKGKTLAEAHSIKGTKENTSEGDATFKAWTAENPKT